MHRAHADTDNGMDTARHGDSRAATLIGVSLMGALGVLFLISTVFSSGSGDREPTSALQTAAEDSAETDTVTMGPVPVLFEQKPRFWLQARAGSHGNAGWGPDVVAPFQRLWQLDSQGGREFFSAPALVDGVLYLGCNDGILRAVDAASGTVKWSFSTICGICGEPAVDSTTVYFGGQDGYVYAVDRASGSRRWSSGLGYHVFCDTGIMCDSLVLSGNSMGRICALNFRTGELVWDLEIGGIVLGPVVVDTLAVFTSESGRTAVVDRGGGLVWSTSHSTQASPPSADSSSVYVGFSGGMVRRFDIQSGNLLWETDIVSGSGRCVLARPVLSGGRVLVGTNDSRLVCLDRQSGDVLWVSEFENWLQLPPAVGHELVYLACDDQRLHVLELETGTRVDSLEMGGYSGTAPVLFDGVVFYGNTSGEFRALRGSPRLAEEVPDETVPAEADSLAPAPAVPAGENAPDLDTGTTETDTLEMVQALPHVEQEDNSDEPDTLETE